MIGLPALSLLPFLVFGAELCVVTLCTLRIIFLSRGSKYLAPALGFFEITIWLFAIGKVMQNLNDPACYLGFAGGFTLGNHLGVLVERWLALGTAVVRTITHKDAGELIESLRAAGFGVTRLDGQGSRGPVTLIFTVVRRKEQDTVLTLIRRFDPDAFYSIDSIQEAGPGIFPERKRLRGIVPSVVDAGSAAPAIATWKSEEARMASGKLDSYTTYLRATSRSEQPCQ